MGEKVKKMTKTIKVNLDECNGCRGCEVACAAFHAKPRYSNSNPYRARIRVVTDECAGVWVPIRSTDYTKVRCEAKRTYTINGREYSECSFCGSICPERDLFKEPDSGLPLKCDLCESDPPLEEPMCVQACGLGCLSLVEVESWVDDDTVVDLNEMDMSLQSLVDKYGFDKVLDQVARMYKKE